MKMAGLPFSTVVDLGVVWDDGHLRPLDFRSSLGLGSAPRSRAAQLSLHLLQRAEPPKVVSQVVQLESPTRRDT